MGSSPHTRCLATTAAAITRRHWLGVSLGAAAGLSGCGKPTTPATPPPRASGSFPQHAYVWQRLWTPAVAAAVRGARGRVAQLTVLGAEIDWSGQQPRLIRPQLDFQAIAEFGGPCSFAVRIGPFPGPFGAQDAHTRQLVAWIGESLALARGGGWEPAGLQIDFDAATSKLAGYRDWLAIFAGAVAPMPISFTALPDWLNSPVLREMAESAGHFVLQVHAVERARATDATASLIDPRMARRWAERAAEFGVPFQIALPTYRSAVGFDAAGKIVGIDSEGPGRSWPEGTRLVTYSSPAAELAALVSDWTGDRPAALRGIIWYRLPVGGEARNWTWATLRPVMSGIAPLEKLEVTSVGENPLDLSLVNSGEAEISWPQTITCRVAGGSAGILAADALGDYRLEFDPAEPNLVVFRKSGAQTNDVLPPGGKKPLGWLRMNSTDYDPTSHELIITIE